MSTSVPYDDYLIELLKNEWRAKAYPDPALEENDPLVFLMALRNVAQAARNKVMTVLETVED